MVNTLKMRKHKREITFIIRARWETKPPSRYKLSAEPPNEAVDGGLQEGKINPCGLQLQQLNFTY